MASFFERLKLKGLWQYKYLIAIILLLTLFSIIAAISAVTSYRISIAGSRHLLETRATDIAVNLGFALERLGLNPDLFPDLVASDRWEYLAFLALIDKDMTCILHSNQKLIGRKMEDPSIKKVFSMERIVTHFERLATGEEVFILDFPLKLHLDNLNRIRNDSQSMASLMGKRPEPETIEPKPALKVYCLRVALHPWPAFSIERKAKFQLVMILSSIVLVWILAIFFVRAWKRNYELERSLAEKERMAALGQMAAVLAHEIRNPLSTIKGFAQIHMEEATDEALKEDMAIIVEQVQRLERLTSNLLIYAKPTEIHLETFRAEELCRELERTLPSDKQDVQLVLECVGDKVTADRTKLVQIVVNLVQNSLEALSGYDSGLKAIHVHIKASDEGIGIKVEDSGPGFPEDIKDRLFEPFFTTKTKGTGLGLAIVKRLTDAMNGQIRVGKSKLGGALVEIFIPLPEED
ncbi:MAG: GHKL domain-containing protein [Thermodesulfobacteria bacterium]|nr:GHKL domain-containing protein [Thermodesulfobacteriota bacterium]